MTTLPPQLRDPGRLAAVRVSGTELAEALVQHVLADASRVDDSLVVVLRSTRWGCPAVCLSR